MNDVLGVLCNPFDREPLWLTLILVSARLLDGTAARRCHARRQKPARLMGKASMRKYRSVLGGDNQASKFDPARIETSRDPDRSRFAKWLRQRQVQKSDDLVVCARVVSGQFLNIA
jgi:hypothetical protein